MTRPATAWIADRMIAACVESAQQTYEAYRTRELHGTFTTSVCVDGLGKLADHDKVAALLRSAGFHVTRVYRKGNSWDCVFNAHMGAHDKVHACHAEATTLFERWLKLYAPDDGTGFAARIDVRELNASERDQLVAVLARDAFHTSARKRGRMCDELVVTKDNPRVAKADTEPEAEEEEVKKKKKGEKRTNRISATTAPIGSKRQRC